MNNIGNKSILIIDDDTRLVNALAKVLTGEGAAVIRADWAGDAIGMVVGGERPIDLVITDLRMPFVSGLTVVFAIHKAHPELPIIVLTAFGSPEVKAECMRQGARAFVEKPVDAQQLLGEIEKAFASPAPDPNSNHYPAKNQMERNELI